MQPLINVVRDIARHEVMQREGAALGVVRSVQGGPDDHSCTVELRESQVVLPKVPIAVGYMGLAALPKEEDLVVVLFINGDLHAPIIVGRLYTQCLKPPDHGSEELVTQLPVSANPDKRVEMRVKTPRDGPRDVSLMLDGDVPVSLAINDEGIMLQTGDVLVKLNQTSASNGSLEVSVGDAKMSFAQSGDINIETTGALTLKGQSVEISGDASVKIAGQKIDLN